MKICSKCKKELGTEMFFKDKTKKDGYRYNCKECDKKWRVENKDKTKGYRLNSHYVVSKEVVSKRNRKYYNAEKKAEYYQANKKVISTKAKEYKSSNKEMFEMYGKEYRETHKEIATAYAKTYQKNNKEKFNIINERRRSKTKQLISTLTNQEWENIKAIFNNKCAYCGKEKPLTQEHIVPVLKGGNYNKENILCACQSCNSSKGTKDYLKWYKKYKYYSKQREELIFSNYGTLNEHFNTQKHILIEKVVSI